MNLSGIDDALVNHWAEYLMEAAGLGLFTMAAGLFTTLFEHPQSPVHQAIADPVTRRALLGLVMGLTATGFSLRLRRRVCCRPQ
jgi:aquaporin Z